MRLGADNPRGVPQMAGRESREGSASGAARDYRLKRFELKTKNRSRKNGNGQRFIASNGDSRHPTAEFRVICLLTSGTQVEVAGGGGQWMLKLLFVKHRTS